MPRLPFLMPGATMLSGRPGPVGVEVPADVWTQDSGVSSVSATTGTGGPGHFCR
jgi:thiamine pyrophosphate-dependent acetolactate synthase large subunit-like protein